MKTLIVYYSLSGKTKIIAETLAKNLNAESEELQDQKNRKGLWRQIVAGIEAGFKKSTTIVPTKYDAADYDLVVIGTPVWASTMACAVRAWLEENATNLKKVAFFATMRHDGDRKTFKDMSTLTQQMPIATFTIIDKNIVTNNYQSQLDNFLAELNKYANN